MSQELPLSLSPLQIVAKIADTVTSCVLLFMETAAQLSLGQTIFGFVDRSLWVVEKSTQWSLPTQEMAAEENGNTFGNIELVRPIPWIVFLPLLIVIRLFRVGLNIGLAILGYPSVEPAAMVKFLQIIRKRLSVIKSNAMENKRQRKSNERDNDTNMNDLSTEDLVTDVAEQMTEMNKWNNKLLQLLIQISQFIQMNRSSLPCRNVSRRSPSPPPTRIKVHVNHSTAISEEQSTSESGAHQQSERNYSEPSSEDQQSEDSEAETVQAKIDRLAAVDDSEDDGDFSPDDVSNLADDSSSTSGDGVSETEIQDIQEVTKSLQCPSSVPKPSESEVTCTSTPVDSNVSETKLAGIEIENQLITQRVFLGVAEAIKEESAPNNHTSVAQSTGEDEKIVNSKAGYATGNFDDFYSPCKLSDDGETAFYSPISSTTPSPDRTVSLVKQGQESGPVEQTQTTNVHQNGEPITKTPISGSTDQTPNGHSNEKGNLPPNIPTKPTNSHHRGTRRASHMSRRKK